MHMQQHHPSHWRKAGVKGFGLGVLAYLPDMEPFAINSEIPSESMMLFY